MMNNIDFPFLESPETKIDLKFCNLYILYTIKNTTRVALFCHTRGKQKVTYFMCNCTLGVTVGCIFSSSFLSFQLLFLKVTGLLPTYFPFISRSALTKSWASAKETKPKPLLFPVFLSRITLALNKVGYLENAFLSISSCTSLPRFPQKIL